MISVLIPTFNYDITELVENLYKQLENSKLKYELLVCDDCSTNQSIVENNEQINNLPSCKFIQNATNLGRTATRKKLAKYAIYDWLLFLDADVMPKDDDFIKRFDVENQKTDIIFGGIEYDCSQKPKQDKLLRWKYGKKRETQTLYNRKKNPYLSIISGCILIKKQTFSSANITEDNFYGSDVAFCWELEKMKAEVLHIDNPVFHLGLDDNKSFLKKSKRGIGTLFYYEKLKIIPINYKSIQRAYRFLKKSDLDSIFVSSIDRFEYLILKNLNSNNPSLFLFDLYRLKYFAVLQQGKTIK